MYLWYPFTLLHICKMTNTLLKPFNRFDIKRLIFLRCRTCFCQNKEKDVTKRYQRYTYLTSHNFLTFEPISKIIFVFSFRYIALSSSCIRYQFGQANKNSFALLHLMIIILLYKGLKGKASIPTDDLIPWLGAAGMIILWHIRFPLLIFINVAFSPRPLGTGMHFQTPLSPLLKVPRMVLLSSLLWWELGTSLPVHGPGEWLSFWRVTSNNSDSELFPPDH